MSFWLVIIITLIIQEGFSTVAVLLRAEQLHYSLWIINTIWLAAAVLQIIFAYRLGKLMQKTFADSKFERWLKKSAKKLEESIDARGEKLALFLLAMVVSPFVAALLASWLDISFSSVFIFSFLGDAFWYASEWATVLGVQELFTKAKEIALVIILIVVAVIFALKVTQKKRTVS